MSRKISLRLPDELIDQVDAIAANTKRDRTAVIIALLQQAMGNDIKPTVGQLADGMGDKIASIESRLSDVEARLSDSGGQDTPVDLSAIESRLSDVESQLSDVWGTVAEYSVGRSQSDTGDSAGQASRRSPDRRNTVSDATMRRRAKSADMDLFDYANREGYSREGVGNRAVWVKVSDGGGQA